MTTITQIWSNHGRTSRWHRLWIEHLKLQDADPDIVGRYQQVADAYATHQPTAERLDSDTQDAMADARHEVVAALAVFNTYAGTDRAHHGLASSDIVDVATQGQILDSLELVTGHACHVAGRLRQLMVDYAATRIVARTHGRPAQLSTWGHRQATVLSPLLDWIDRALDTIHGYPMRPPTGAVGTAADLGRVLGHPGAVTEVSRDGLEATTSVSDPSGGVGIVVGTSDPGGPRIVGGLGPLDLCGAELAGRLGFNATMDASRQTYHRSYDLRVASLLSELASIAQTWASDRRLEAMLGLGNEAHLTEQTASSSMANKMNPRFSERIVALSVVTRSHLGAVAEMAGMEWLEGDVSTSAARKLILPAMFQNIDAILANWLYVAGLWQVNEWEMKIEVDTYRYEWASAEIMHRLVLGGLSRTDAHRCLREAWARARRPTDHRDLPEWFEVSLGAVLSEMALSPIGGLMLTREWVRGVVIEMLDAPIGNISDQIDWLDRRAHTTVGMLPGGDIWEPEVAP
jgi:adenylosuccinate lyase